MRMAEQHVRVDGSTFPRQLEPELADPRSAVADEKGAGVRSYFDARGVAAIADGGRPRRWHRSAGSPKRDPHLAEDCNKAFGTTRSESHAQAFATVQLELAAAIRQFETRAQAVLVDDGIRQVEVPAAVVEALDAVLGARHEQRGRKRRCQIDDPPVGLYRFLEAEQVADEQVGGGGAPAVGVAAAVSSP